ncbi:MAG: hypothetical protein JNK60_05725, partial [Acidobacteria bacterium]|nr:hypothetical protein [Acidobacteriota bacterium]
MTPREKALRGVSALVLVLLAVAVALDRREVTLTANATRASLASGGLPAALALADQGRPYRSWFSAPALETRLFD